MVANLQTDPAYSEFLRAVEEMLHVQPNSLSGAETLRDLPAWDSLTVVEFMSLADQKYGVAISARQLRDSNSLQDLFGLVQSR